MLDRDAVTWSTPMAFWGHPAGLEPSEMLPEVKWPAEPALASLLPGDPAFEPWRQRTRISSGSPRALTISVPAFVIALGLPTFIPAAPPLFLPQAVLDEPEVLAHIATVAEPSAPDETAPDPTLADELPAQDLPLLTAEPKAYWFTPLKAVELIELPVEPEPAVAPLPVAEAPEPVVEEPPSPMAEPALASEEEQAIALEAPDGHSATVAEAALPSVLIEREAPAPPAPEPVPAPAYWATDPDLEAESLAWAPPPAPAEARRPTPAMAGLWAAEPVLGTEYVPPQQVRTGRGIPSVAKVAAGVAVLAAASVAVAVIVPRLLSRGGIPVATFNAPMMVLRAATAGRVANVAVKNGQAVEPSTLLLTIHTEPQPDPAASLLQDRMEAARGHLAAIDDALGQPIPSTEAGRSRLADLRRQRAAAATDVAQLQDAVTNLPARPSADQPVRAGVHGVIRSLEAQPGTLTVSGLPLVRMLDCDHAFLTLPPGADLRVGQPVQVRLANLPAVPATVRRSVGIAEPPDSLVIAPAPGAFIGILSGSCPLGATATVTAVAGS